MNDYLVKTLREGRINKGLKQSDVAEMVGVKANTLSNYENGVSEPDIDTFANLCEIYELDFAYVLGEAYGLGVSGTDFEIKPSEIEIIKKYRSIDHHGKEMVDFTLQKEWERSTNQNFANDVEKYEYAQKLYSKALLNKKNISIDDMVKDLPSEDEQSKTLSQLADDLINAANAIENSSKEDRFFDENIMDDKNF